MSTSTYNQAKSLFDDLEKAEGQVSWQIGKVGNALLEQAKQENPDNVALAQLDPFEESSHGGYIVHMTATDVRAIIRQIVTATKPPRLVGIA